MRQLFLLLLLLSSSSFSQTVDNKINGTSVPPSQPVIGTNAAGGLIPGQAPAGTVLAGTSGIQQPSTAGSALTISGPTVTGDVVKWGCIEY